MSANEDNNRQYGTSDANMLQFSYDMQDLLVENLADFAAFDAEFTEEYANDYLEIIDTARNYNSDMQMKAYQKEATNNRTAKMKDCQECFQDLKFFVKKAFKTNTSVQEAFGFDDYNNVRSEADALTQFMFDAHETAEKYSTELNAAKYSAVQIANIHTVALALQKANTTQTSKKGIRKTSTGERIKLNNKAFETTQYVCEAAQRVYVDDPIKASLFHYTWGGNSGGNTNTVTGTIKAGETKRIYLDDLVGSSMIRFVLSNPARACGSVNPNTDCDGGDIMQGGTTDRTLQSISSDPNPTVLKLHHNVMGPDAPDITYTITVLVED